MTNTIALECHCKSVRVELQGSPAARAHCHCQTCRDFYGTAMLSATAWDPQALHLVGGEVAQFAHPTKQLSRAFCPSCGETMYGTNRLGMRIVPNSVMARAHGGTLPEALQPAMHLFYRHRVIDVHDTLIKYLDGWDGPVHESAVTVTD